tara:strand:+ start:147 stop:551 length:405 start_codon:yes stop_codon:yes gene_type:complete
MKKTLLILFIYFFCISISSAGGDDRDQQQQLLDSLIEESSETPNFLQEDGSDLIQLDVNEADELAQPKLDFPEASGIIQDTNDSKTVSSSPNEVKAPDYKILINYFKTEQGMIILLIFFALSLILLFNFFVREK